MGTGLQFLKKKFGVQGGGGERGVVHFSGKLRSINNSQDSEGLIVKKDEGGTKDFLRFFFLLKKLEKKHPLIWRALKKKK